MARKTYVHPSGIVAHENISIEETNGRVGDRIRNGRGKKKSRLAQRPTMDKPNEDFPPVPSHTVTDIEPNLQQ
ncbi:hypothetical protein TorRG33x02_353890 [Trema orientale]|uniref:Uncharacterized protein n=1 Tax=Trema orientale TaxID=63057 RepID=A0A2P5AC55_TREOI|nr:hypothetical protein TorRG33x02_353890 [Trema orientale]